jgi:hypothetical protein
MNRYRHAVALAAVAVGVFAAPGAALADTVPSPIGSVTAGQYLGDYCDDFGATVQVTVAGGLAGTAYTAQAPGQFSGPHTFVTDGAGAGQTVLNNVVTPAGAISGVTQVAVTAAGTTVSVPATIHCESPKGD